MVYASPTWEYAVDAHLLKLQRLQNRILATGNRDRRTAVRELHVAFKIPYVCDYISVLRRKHAEFVQITEIQMYRQLDKRKPCIGSTRGLNVAGSSLRPFRYLTDASGCKKN
jgi:hypothetical protein